MTRYEVQTTSVSGRTEVRYAVAATAEAAVEAVKAEWSLYGDEPPVSATVVASWAIQS